jgi:predicted amidophosphoribosyltransferase
MIEVCCSCNADIEFMGDPQYVICPRCGILNFRYTWEMCMSPEELATERLLTVIEWWFPERDGCLDGGKVK